LSHSVPVQNAPRKSYGAGPAKVTVRDVAKTKRDKAEVIAILAIDIGDEFEAMQGK